MPMRVGTDSTGGRAIGLIGGSEQPAGAPEPTGIGAVADAEPNGTTWAATGNEAGSQADTREVAR